jgi:hypothetical protein
MKKSQGIILSYLILIVLPEYLSEVDKVLKKVMWIALEVLIAP